MIKWNKVTWYSKFAAVIFFLLILPIWTFCLGRYYEKTLIAIEEEMKGPLALYPLGTLQTRETFRSGTASATLYSGIEGKATIGPTCPVETIENPCLPSPYSAHIAVINSKGKVVTETVATKNGSFTIFLPAGTYTVRNADISKPFPSLFPQEVTVNQNKITHVLLEFDSGIR